MKTPNVEAIARVCHEANSAYARTLGDASHVPWDAAPEWQRRSAIDGIVFFLANPRVSPSSLHENWAREKLNAGWTWGPVKDPQKKQHPSLVPYDELPAAERRKDLLFRAVASALTEAL